jgi:hypothetical protein
MAFLDAYSRLKRHKYYANAYKKQKLEHDLVTLQSVYEFLRVSNQCPIYYLKEFKTYIDNTASDLPNFYNTDE